MVSLLLLQSRSKKGVYDVTRKKHSRRDCEGWGGM